MDNRYAEGLFWQANGSYERDATSSAGGTGEALVADYLRLLNRLHKEKENGYACRKTDLSETPHAPQDSDGGVCQAAGFQCG